MSQKQKENIPNPTIPITELEALRFAVLDTELRNHLQGQRIIELELEKAEREFKDNQNIKRKQIDRLKQLAEKIKPEYTKLIEELGKKYKISPRNIIIDPDTRTIRDLSKI